MTGRALIAVTVALMLAAPVLAGDIIGIPTGNTVAPGDLELNAIYLNGAPSGGDGDLEIGEAFLGIMDRVELDAIHVRERGGDNYTEVNGYLTLVKEAASHPSLIVGASNLLGSDWVTGNDDVSWFAVSSFNLATPEAITPQTPAVRLHLGYGAKDHGDRAFAGIQFKTAPNFGGAIFTYNAMMHYMLTWAPCKRAELSAGVIDGDAFYRLGINTAL